MKKRKAKMSEDNDGWIEYEGTSVRLRTDGNVDCFSGAGYQVVKAADCDPELLKILQPQENEDE